MNRPASNYLDLNTPEQQRQAAALLRWPWSPPALHALTTYFRSMEDVTTTAQLTAALTELLGHVPPVMLDVQRELGGITLPYGWNRALDFDLSDTGGLIEDTQSFYFAWEEAVPIWSIDAQGQIFDGKRRYCSAQQCVEWHVAIRLFALRKRMGLSYLESAMRRGTSDEALKPSLRALAQSLGVELDERLTDRWNLLWASEQTQLVVHRLGNDGIDIWIHTEQLEGAEKFSSWCGANDLRINSRQRFEPPVSEEV